MPSIQELLQNRTGMLEQAKALVDKSDRESRSLSKDECTQYDDLIAKIEAVTRDIEARDKVEKLLKFEYIAEPTRPDPGKLLLGLSPSEIRSYSLLRAIGAAASQNWDGAGIEQEASRAMAKALGKDPNGFFVPHDVLGVERRDITSGSASGGYLIGTDTLASNFVDLLKNRMVVRAAGATVLGGLVGSLSIPKQTGGATAYWVAESGSATESQQTIGQVALSPKTVGAFTDISRKLLKQGSLDVERFVRDDLAATLAIAIDLAALHGTGASNQPYGIASTTGIGDVAGGTNGLAPNWSHIVSLEKEVAIDNADYGRLAYITNPKVRGKLKQTPKWAEVTPTGGSITALSMNSPVWADGPTPLNGYPAFITNQVSSTLYKTPTSGSLCSAIFFGNWADLIIGLWGALDILVDPYSNSTSGTLRVVAFQDVDIAVRHPESFAAMLDALPA